MKLKIKNPKNKEIKNHKPKNIKIKIKNPEIKKKKYCSKILKQRKI